MTALFDADKVSSEKSDNATADRTTQANIATQSLVAPPRTISDVAAILDQQKPDASKVAELTETADAAVPSDAAPTGQHAFLRLRLPH